MSFLVAEIDEALAQSLNDGYIDDDKVAYRNEDNTKFYVKQQWANDNLEKKQLISSGLELTQSEVDGTMPVVKTKRIYP